MKIGSRNLIDSFIPRRFRYSSNSVSRTASPSLALPKAGGSSENRASTRLATDIQHVVHDQRAARDETGIGSKQVRGDLVAAAPIGKQLDDLAVGNGDYEYGYRRHCRKVEA